MNIITTIIFWLIRTFSPNSSLQKVSLLKLRNEDIDVYKEKRRIDILLFKKRIKSAKTSFVLYPILSIVSISICYTRIFDFKDTALDSILLISFNSIEDARSHISDVTAILASIISLGFVVIILLIENIKEKSTRAANEIFMHTSMYQSFSICISAMSAALLIMLIDNSIKDKYIVVNMAILATYLTIITCIVIARYFYKVIRFIDPTTEAEVIKQYLLTCAKRAAIYKRIKVISQGIIELELQKNTIPYDYLPSTEEYKRQNINKSMYNTIISDINIPILRKYIKALVTLSNNAEVYFKKIHLGIFLVENSEIAYIPKNAGTTRMVNYGLLLVLERKKTAIEEQEYESAKSTLITKMHNAIDSNNIELLKSQLIQIEELYKVRYNDK